MLATPTGSWKFQSIKQQRPGDSTACVLPLQQPAGLPSASQLEPEQWSLENSASRSARPCSQLAIGSGEHAPVVTAASTKSEFGERVHGRSETPVINCTQPTGRCSDRRLHREPELGRASSDPGAQLQVSRLS